MTKQPKIIKLLPRRFCHVEMAFFQAVAHLLGLGTRNQSGSLAGGQTQIPILGNSQKLGAGPIGDQPDHLPSLAVLPPAAATG